LSSRVSASILGPCFLASDSPPRSIGSPPPLFSPLWLLGGVFLGIFFPDRHLFSRFFPGASRRVLLRPSVLTFSFPKKRVPRPPLFPWSHFSTFPFSSSPSFRPSLVSFCGSPKGLGQSSPPHEFEPWAVPTTPQLSFAFFEVPRFPPAIFVRVRGCLFFFFSA